MEKGIQKASDELATQLNDIRALKQFVKYTRDNLTQEHLTQKYVGKSAANQRRAMRMQTERTGMRGSAAPVYYHKTKVSGPKNTGSYADVISKKYEKELQQQ